MKTMHIGIIGCGVVTRRHHLPAFVKDNRVVVKALCDTKIEASKNVAKRFGLKCSIYAQPQDIICDNDIDVIDICTPGPTHFQLAKECLANGKNVLLEKPPVFNVKEAEELINLAADNNVKIGTIFNNRFRDVIIKHRFSQSDKSQDIRDMATK